MSQKPSPHLIFKWDPADPLFPAVPCLDAHQNQDFPELNESPARVAGT